MTPERQALLIRRSVWLIVIAAALAVLPVSFCAVVLPGCVSCHERVELVADVTSRAHADAGANCVSCHVGDSVVDRVRFGYYQAYGMYVPLLAVSDSPVSVVRDARCTSCHSDMSGTWSAAGLRIRHETCAEGSTCSSCHANTAHLEELAWPTTYSMDGCLECHDTREVRESCETCHTGRLTSARPTTGSWSLTHGPDWERTHGMGEMSTCGACHVEGYCDRCHGPGIPHDERFYEQHGNTAGSEGAQCMSCHATAFCDACHGIQMPHPVEFTRQHSTQVEAEGEALCRGCHAQDDCIVCHEMHIHPGGSVPLSPDGRTRP